MSCPCRIIGMLVFSLVNLAACSETTRPESRVGLEGGVDSGASVGTEASVPPESAGSPPDAGASLPPSAAGFHIDLQQTSVSGLSSGAFMAVQFHVAFSSIMQGAAIFAGGPFDCAQGSVVNALTECADALEPPDVTPLVALTQQWASAGFLDDVSGLARQRVFLFGGAEDTTVNPVVMDALDTYYQAFLNPQSIDYESRQPGTGHTMPTLDYGGPCALSAAPWIGKCSYDGAGEALAQIYGPLSPSSPSPTGTFLPLAQGDFVADPASHSLADTAYVYAPASCANGEVCRIHVAFHGCLQEATGPVGNAFYTNAGYNAWADTNHIVVVYPQTIASAANPSNPEACWDWWGYDSPDYAQKSGPQMAMVRAMIDYLASPVGAAGG
jgi:hypothetical protein